MGIRYDFSCQLPHIPRSDMECEIVSFSCLWGTEKGEKTENKKLLMEFAVLRSQEQKKN